MDYFNDGINQQGDYNFQRGDVVRMKPPYRDAYGFAIKFDLPVPVDKRGDAFSIIVDKSIREGVDFFSAEVAARGNPLADGNIRFRISEAPGAVEKFKNFLQSVQELLPRRGIPLGLRGSFVVPADPTLQRGRPYHHPQGLPPIGQLEWVAGTEGAHKMPIMLVQFGKGKEELAKAQALQAALKAQGIQFMEHHNAQGPRVHVWNEGMDAVAAHWNWRHSAAGGGANYLGVPVRDREEGQKKMEALSAMGISAVLNDTKDGLAVCVRNLAEGMRIFNARKMQGLPPPSGQLEGPGQAFKGPRR